MADLWNHDVPMLLTRPASRVIIPANGIGSSTAPESAWERLTGLLGRLGDRHQRDQKWIIQAAFATRAPRIEHLARPSRELTGTEDVDPGRLIAEACAIADELCAAAQYRGEHVGWLSLEPADGMHWSLTPLGAGLGDGYLGVALFLVALARQTGIPRYLDLATRVPARPAGSHHAVPQRRAGSRSDRRRRHGRARWYRRAVAQLSQQPAAQPACCRIGCLATCWRCVATGSQRRTREAAVSDWTVTWPGACPDW